MATSQSDSDPFHPSFSVSIETGISSQAFLALLDPLTAAARVQVAFLLGKYSLGNFPLDAQSQLHSIDVSLTIH